MKELPPHTRRRGRRYSRPHTPAGTTSAYAEKSPRPVVCWAIIRNYLRIRGEEATRYWAMTVATELPPHTRRRELLKSSMCALARTTSAYAEKSAAIMRARNLIWNYLRIRGEEEWLETGNTPAGELPPHTRRRGALLHAMRRRRGTTSAYAEKRDTQIPEKTRIRNYLRIRGEEPVTT